MHKSQFSISCWHNNYLHAMPNVDYQKIDLKSPQTKHNKLILFLSQKSNNYLNRP